MGQRTELVIDRGARVRFTASGLGTVSNLSMTRFEPEVVHAGDEGRYLMPHPNPRLGGWHVIEVVIGGRTLYVPCGDGQFEAVA